MAHTPRDAVDDSEEHDALNECISEAPGPLVWGYSRSLGRSNYRLAQVCIRRGETHHIKDDKHGGRGRGVCSDENDQERRVHRTYALCQHDYVDANRVPLTRFDKNADHSGQARPAG